MSSSTGGGPNNGQGISSYINANFDDKSGGFGDKLNYLNGGSNGNGQRFGLMNGMNSSEAANNLQIPLSMISSSSSAAYKHRGAVNPHTGEINTASLLASFWNKEHQTEDKSNVYQQKELRLPRGMEDGGMSGDPSDFQRRLEELKMMQQGLSMMSPGSVKQSSDPDKRARWAEATRRRFENMSDNQKDLQKAKWAEAARRREANKTDYEREIQKAKWAEAARLREANKSDYERDAQKAKWAEAARRRYSRMTPEQKRELGQRQTERKRIKRQQDKMMVNFQDQIQVDIDFLEQQQAAVAAASSSSQQQQQLHHVALHHQQQQQQHHRSMQNGGGM